MIHRAIVLVHGVGRQQHGDTLDDIVEPLVEFLGGRALGYENVRLVARNARSPGAPASARIHLLNPANGDLTEVWHVREAWWAQIFRPSPPDTMLGWAVQTFFLYVASTLDLEALTVRRVLGDRPKDHGVWTTSTAGSFPFYAVDLVAWLAINVAYLMAFLLGALIILPLYLFLLMPGLQLLPGIVGRVQRALLDTFSGGIGEQQAATNRHVAVAEAATVVTEALRPFLEPATLSRAGIEYETVTVIAHSGGCVVSFEALAGETVRRWCADPHWLPGRINWVTLGSGLNLGWRMQARHKDKDRTFWYRCISGYVNWINIYARYDPVPQGEPPEELVQALTQESLESQPWLRVRVANGDSPLTDHGGYWTNLAEVVPRLVHAIADSRLGKQPIATLGGSLNLSEPLVLDRVAADELTNQGPEHRRQVSVHQAIRLVSGGVALALLLRYQSAVERLGGRLLGLLGWTWPHGGFWGWLSSVWPSWLEVVRSQALHEWLVGALIIAYGAVAVVYLIRLIGMWVSRGATEPKPSWPPKADSATPN